MMIILRAFSLDTDYMIAILILLSFSVLASFQYGCLALTQSNFMHSFDIFSPFRFERIVKERKVIPTKLTKPISS